MKVSDFIICEDIRLEVGGKSSLMGVLGDNLNFHGQGINDWPKNITIAIFLRVDVGEDRPSKFKIEAVLNGDQVALIEDDLTIPEKTKIISIPIIFRTLPIKETGTLDFLFEMLSDETLLIEESRSLTINVKE